MMIAADSLPKRIWTRALPTLCLMAALVGCVVLGAFVSFVGPMLAGNETAVIFVLPAVWPLIYLVTKRFGLAIVATFVTFGFVQFEPAPFDLLIAAMIALGLLVANCGLNGCIKRRGSIRRSGFFLLSRWFRWLFLTSYSTVCATR